MRYELRVSHKKGITYDTTNLVKHIEKSVPGVKSGDIEFKVIYPIMGFEDGPRKATKAKLSFFGNSFNPAEIMSEICERGYYIEASKLTK